MKKDTIILLSTLFLIICGAMTSGVVSQSNSKNEDDGVESVSLEMEKIVFCPLGRGEEGNCDKKQKVGIFTVSKAAEKEGLDYYYLVDGGEIIGKGANVIWDFSKSKVGTYSITVGVGKDSVIKGRIITKSFVFEACGACDLGCACPNLSVSAPTAPAKRGENLIFSARILGGTQDRPAFSWSVSDGEIIKIIQKETESQILVKTSPTTKSKQIIATVEVGGLCMPECERTALAIAQIKK